MQRNKRLLITLGLVGVLPRQLLGGGHHVRGRVPLRLSLSGFDGVLTCDCRCSTGPTDVHGLQLQIL